MHHRHQSVSQWDGLGFHGSASLYYSDMTHGSVNYGLSWVLSLQVRNDVEKLGEIKKAAKIAFVQEFLEMGETQLRAIWLQCRWEVDEYFQQPESKLFLVVPNSITRNSGCKPQHGKFRLDTRKDFHWKDETLGNDVWNICSWRLGRFCSTKGWEMSPCTAGDLDCTSLEVPSNYSVFLCIQICFFFIQKKRPRFTLSCPYLFKNTSFLKSPNWSQ